MLLSSLLLNKIILSSKSNILFPIYGRYFSLILIEYGLEKSKEILHQITNEAILELDEFGEKAEFLTNLARYIETRNK